MRWKLPTSPFWGGYLACGVLALAAIWLHEYPAGIDLPQHANLFQLLANYGDVRSGYRIFYRLDFFTPYALPYVLAWPFAKIGGALFATKVVLTTAVLGLPLGLARWLRAVNGEPNLGLIGFVVAFGFGYQWGFLSFLLSGSVSLFYLSAAEEMKRDRRASRIVLPVTLGILLFFCHGATFALTMAASGLSCLFQRRLRSIAFDLLHFLPIGAVFVAWYSIHQKDATGGYRDLPTQERIVSLFSGIYRAGPTYFAALAGLATAALLFAVGRPTLTTKPARLLPLLFALVGLFSVPEWVGGTWLVGTRFVHFVHCYGAGGFDFRKDARGRRLLAWVVFGLTVTVLASVNYRLYVFNQELDGLDRIRKLIPPGSDLQLHIAHHASETFGEGQHGQVVAWIPTAQGGFLENDSGAYWNNPVQRRDVPWPNEWPYHVARGSLPEARAVVGFGMEHVKSEGYFHLFKKAVARVDVPGLKMIRYGQSWATPKKDRSVIGRVLTVGGREYATGIGAHARGILQMRPEPGVRRVRGLVGLDEGAPGVGTATFEIMDAERRSRWTSGALTQGDAAQPFDVSVDSTQGDVFLVTDPVGGSISDTHADWLEIVGASQ